MHLKSLVCTSTYVLKTINYKQTAEKVKLDIYRDCRGTSRIFRSNCYQLIITRLHTENTQNVYIVSFFNQRPAQFQFQSSATKQSAELTK